MSERKAEGNLSHLNIGIKLDDGSLYSGGKDVGKGNKRFEAIAIHAFTGSRIGSGVWGSKVAQPQLILPLASL
jgi:hypothetical protein